MPPAINKPVKRALLGTLLTTPETILSPTPMSAAATMREARDKAPRGRARRGETDIKKGT